MTTSARATRSSTRTQPSKRQAPVKKGRPAKTKEESKDLENTKDSVAGAFHPFSFFSFHSDFLFTSESIDGITPDELAVIRREFPDVVRVSVSSMFRDS